MPALLGILALGFAQGLLGWYMVESGLVDRVEVSQYRLVAHLALALAIYGLILWIALGIVPSTPGWAEQRYPISRWSWPARRLYAFAGSPSSGDADSRPRMWNGGAGWRRAAEAVILLVGLTIAAGGFIAGTRAGLTYNTFPLMDGRLVPTGYAQLRPFIRNWFENIAAMQFDHRLLAMTTAAAVLLLWAAGCAPPSRPRPRRSVGIARRGSVAGGARHLDPALVVPIPLAAAHQAGAVHPADRSDRAAPHLAPTRHHRRRSAATI